MQSATTDGSQPSADVPRYLPDRPLPPYSYVPGQSPHPTSHELGHSFGIHEPTAIPLDESNFAINSAYLFALDLFNHGYYWEAHEAWEQLWHCAGRTGRTADFLKGLIKLAAAGVKLREGRAKGVKQHAQRAAELLTGVASRTPAADTLFGLRMSDICDFAATLAATAAACADTSNPDHNRSLEYTLRLENG